MPSGLRALAHRVWAAVRRGLSPHDHQDGPPSVGKQGEEAAAACLRQRGYRILQRNAKSRFGEIDIVALDGDVLCFVEVKTRRSAAFGEAAAAVPAAKQRQIERAALDFARKRGMTRADCRFDVVAVSLAAEGQPQVEVFPGAFESKLHA